MQVNTHQKFSSMYRYFISLFCFFLFSFFSTEAQTNKKNTLQENNLKGRVKTTEEIEYGTIDATGNIEKDADFSGKTITTYNRYGNIREQKVVDSKGIMGFKTVYKYEDNLKTKELSYNSKNKITERWMAVYNNKREIKEAYRVFEGRNIEKRMNTYDNKGKLLEEKWYLNNQITHKKIHTYLDDNKTVEIKTLDPLDSIIAIEMLKYNSQGSLLEESKYNLKDSLHGKTICLYNENKQLIKEITYNSNDIIENKTVYVYDEKGNVLEEIWYNHNNEKTSHIKNEYTFDKQGNWIKKIEYDSEIKFGAVFKRIINYYN